MTDRTPMAKYALAVLLLVSLAVHSHAAKQKVDWRKLDNEVGSGLARFDKSDYAFSVADNLVYCRKNSEVMKHDTSILDYGPAIEQALDRLNAKGGGTLNFETGTYYIQTQFSIPSFTCLKGAGMYKTILKVHKDAPPFPKAGMMRTRHTVRVSLFDFTQDGNRDELPGEPQNRFGVYTHLANYVWMKNVAIMNNKWYGFDPHGANTAWSYYLVMEDCYSSGNGKDGYTIDQYYYVSLLNSYAENNDRHGINVVSGSRYVLIKGNKVRNNAHCSLVVQNNEFGTRSTRFVENVGIAHGRGGVCIRDTFDVQAIRNKFYSNLPKSSAYQLQKIWNTTLADNEWVRGPKEFSGFGDNDFDEFGTKIIEDTPEVSKRFNSYFAGAKMPPAADVDLNDDTYGTAVSDNTIPEGPRRLTLRSDTAPPPKLSQRKSTHRQFADKKGNNPADSDARCETGVRNDIYCCPEKCGKCVRDNCFSKDPECCPDSIRIAANSCDTFSPPCVMSRKYTATGRLFGPAHEPKDAIFPENQTSGEKKPAPVEKKPEMPKPDMMKPDMIKPEMVKPEISPEMTPEMMMPEMPEPDMSKPDMMKPEIVEKPEKDDDDDDEDDKKELMTKKMSESDPNCKYGVRNSKTCCPKSCGKCGGKGCGKRGPNKMCCQREIRKTGRMCSKYDAPCIIKK